MGHILGAASVTLEVGGRRITFSGDIGRYSVPILKDPAPVEFGDLLLIESTYGDRLHGEELPQEKLARLVSETVERRGIVLIPSFAVGRTQLILFYIRELKEQGKIPDIPVVIDSPMATDATAVYKNNPGCYDEEALGIVKGGRQPFLPNKIGFTRDRRDSIKLNAIDKPMIIISASGMLTGGRILHHLRHSISSPLNTVVVVGYQPPGGRGDWMKSGAQSMKLFGEEIPLRCQVEEVSGLSAHGDRDEMLTWCRQSTGTPGRVMVVHGEHDSAKAFAGTLREEFGWDARPAKYLEEIEI
jgi:metallo-beta-lactamase family protein